MQKAKSKKQKASIDITHTSKLANLFLTKDEEKLFDTQLKEVVGYISKLSEVETEKVEPIGHITGLETVTREDEPSPSLSQEDALANAFKVHNGFFQVDAIFEEE